MAQLETIFKIYCSNVVHRICVSYKSKLHTALHYWSNLQLFVIVKFDFDIYYLKYRLCIYLYYACINT